MDSISPLLIQRTLSDVENGLFRVITGSPPWGDEGIFKFSIPNGIEIAVFSCEGVWKNLEWVKYGHKFIDCKSMVENGLKSFVFYRPKNTRILTMWGIPSKWWGCNTADQ